jgi:exonuclease V gamma subunit
MQYRSPHDPSNLDHSEALQNSQNLTVRGIFARTIVVIPHASIKEWLQLEICRNRDNAATIGLEFVSWEIALARVAGPLPIPTRAELLASIWQATDSFDSEKKKLDFVEHLVSLFWEYSRSGCPQNIPEEGLWQKTLFEEIFQKYSWQTLPDALRQLDLREVGSLILFGIDHLPTAVHRFFLKYQKLSVFRFSPTSMFWEDLNSSDEELRNVQPLLANWGSLGRKMLADAAAFPTHEDENYSLEINKTTLQKLKTDLLLLEKQDFSFIDNSIRCLKTGTSRLLEVQTLRLEIARLAREGISLSDMRVYAPDIAAYAPLIEFCFSGSQSIPVRISGTDLSRKSSFYQAIVCLFQCVKGRWDLDQLFDLFELSAFYQKANWQREDVKRFQKWARQVKIRWGLDALHRQETAEIDTVFHEVGSWKSGFAELIDSWIFLQPEKEELMSWCDADLFKSFYEAFYSLAQTLLSWKTEKKFFEWAEEIEKLVRSTLFLDESSEAERAAARSFSLFLDLLRKLAKKFPEEKFPLSVIQTYFATFSSGEGEGSLLHAVRFASLELGSIVPARILFILGVDEENFPRSIPPSSLQLSPPQPSISEIDRYLFLQAIFAAKERLIFSYSHRSKEDGKSVNPSLLIQELFGYLGAVDPFEAPIHPEPPSNHFSFVTNHEKLPEIGSIPTVLSIQELTRFFKNPFQYYLKSFGIVLGEEPDSPWKDFELSSLERYGILRNYLSFEPRAIYTPSSRKLGRQVMMAPSLSIRTNGSLLEIGGHLCGSKGWDASIACLSNFPLDGVYNNLPLNLFGDAAKLHVEQRMEEFQSSLMQWGIELASIQTLLFQETGLPLRMSIEGQPILLIGQADLIVPTGVLHMGSDEIGSFLRKWPEMLCALIANRTNRIYNSKTGKIREVFDPELALQGAIELYLRCQRKLFFLHPEWADDVLRKHRIPAECKDRVALWVMKRSPQFSLHTEQILWKETLERIFAPLTALFARGAYAEI